MAADPTYPSILRQILTSGALILMLIGLLLIPFVATEIAIGVAAMAGVLFLLVKFLMPEKKATKDET